MPRPVPLSACNLSTSGHLCDDRKIFASFVNDLQNSAKRVLTTASFLGRVVFLLGFLRFWLAQGGGF